MRRALGKAAEEYRVAVEEIESMGGSVDTPRGDLPFDRPAGEGLDDLAERIQQIQFYERGEGGYRPAGGYALHPTLGTWSKVL